MNRQDIINIRAGTSRVFRFDDPKQITVARSMIQNIKQNEEMPSDVERYTTTTDGSTRQIVITAVPKYGYTKQVEFEDIP